MRHKEAAANAHLFLKSPFYRSASMQLYGLHSHDSLLLDIEGKKRNNFYQACWFPKHRFHCCNPHTGPNKPYVSKVH